VVSGMSYEKMTVLIRYLVRYRYTNTLRKMIRSAGRHRITGTSSDTSFYGFPDGNYIKTR
jgi:hypothetical protein